MISKKLFEELNNQVNYEFESAHIYLAMEAYFASKNLPGFENFFKVQVEEERAHAKLFFNYISRMNGDITIGTMAKPNNEFESIIDPFKKALEHEKFITSRIYLLMDLAIEEKEHATISFLKWFVDEQVEEEESFTNIIAKLERIGNDVNGLYMLDTELAARVFVPPVITK